MSNIPVVTGQDGKGVDKVIWMPYEEYELWRRMNDKMSEEQKRQRAYFFWNNFSMEGYEEYIKKNANS